MHSTFDSSRLLADPPADLSAELTADVAADLPPGLTTLDLTRIAGAAAAAQAPATRKIYGHAWDHGCGGANAAASSRCPPTPPPSAPTSSNASTPASQSSAWDPSAAPTATSTRLHGFPNPKDDPTARQVRAGLRRLYGTAPRRQARPLAVPELRQILAAIDRNTIFGARDAAIILLGYASALRCSELANLTLADLDTQPGGLLTGY